MVLVGRQWFFATTEQPIPVPATTVAAPHVETQADEVEPATVATSDPSAAVTPPSPTATTGSFRGRAIDSVTRRPVKELEVRLVCVQRSGESYREEEPLTRTFQSETGRFTWGDLAPSSWMADVTAPGYQLFHLGEVKVVAGKTTRETVMPLLRGYAVRGRVFERSTGAAVADAWVTFRETSEWRGEEVALPYEVENRRLVRAGRRSWRRCDLVDLRQGTCATRVGRHGRRQDAATGDRALLGRHDLRDGHDCGRSARQSAGHGIRQRRGFWQPDGRRRPVLHQASARGSPHDFGQRRRRHCPTGSPARRG